MEFDNRVALVTGAASGIGRAVALSLAEHGAHVGMADIDFAGAEKAASGAVGGRHLALSVDVTSTQSVAAGVAATVETLGPIDILVNVAGWDRIAPFVETDEAFWDRVIGVNFRGVLATCRAVLPGMIERGVGVVVNTASEAGRAGSSGEAVYSGAKGAVIAFTKSLAREVARHGVRVNAVAPGLTQTPLLESMIADGHGRLIDAIVRSTPLRRLATAEEVANAVLFLASDRASFVTGQTIGVGGGLVMV